MAGIQKFAIVFGLLTFAVGSQAQRSPSATSSNHDVVQSQLIAPGSAPFHLTANMRLSNDRTYAKIEMYWLAPDKYRRTIDALDFKQTRIVNGDQTFEQNSSDYFPLLLQTLVTAMVDPKPILDAVRPGDLVATKANGGVRFMQLPCMASSAGLCPTGLDGLREVVAASGHSVAFADYQPFEGKQVARLVTNAPRLGEDIVTLNVLKLEKWKSPDLSLLDVSIPTPQAQRIRIVDESGDTLQNSLIGNPQIIWPQPLDGAQKGPASFYVSMDKTGNLREVQQLYTANERTNDSAISQIKKWKFKPIEEDGVPVQAEGVLAFTLDTRAWGPADALTNEEARKLATGIVEPDFPRNFPSGTVYTLWIAVDSEGRVIEAMAGDGPNALWSPCYDALRKWQFHPVMENGQPRPYRAQIAFRVP